MKVILFFFSFRFLECSEAKLLFEYQRPIWSMGMGGVYSVFPREGDMPTANAAALRYVHTMDLELFNLNLGGPGLNDIQNLQSLPGLSSFSNLNSYFGKPLWTGVEGRVSFVMPYFGASIYQNYYLHSNINNPLVPEWDVNYLQDSGMTVAGAFALGPELSAGFGLKRLSRTGGYSAIDFNIINQYMSTQDVQTILDQFQDKGIAYGMDMSLLYKTDNVTTPIATLVWKDVGGTAFQKTAGPEAPPHIEQNLILGLGYDYDGPIIGAKAGMEYHYIQKTDVQIGQKLHFGTELSLPLIDLRAGVSQGYTTYGFGLNLWFLRLEAAQFTEEAGAYPGQSPEQRIQVAITLDLSVDADFNITGKDGKKRKLKQRR